ncbi:MAG: HD domain-containing protein [Candidatus Thorarchaeota archaeon]|nr:HD domain-containing protein [Candidatus Thorarchaeota archaeon]
MNQANIPKGNSVRHQQIDPDLIQLIRVTGLREQNLVTAKASGGAALAKIEKIVSNHKRLLSLGEKHSRQKAIQDPIHGAIIFDPWELDILSSWEMLRLRFVKQLGPAHIVYPGATHTRFEHCMGTSFLAQKCISVVNYCNDIGKPCFVPLSNLLDDYHQKIFRAAALLHDIGHPPTSHSIEYALEAWAGLDHLDLGEHILLNSSITEILQQNDMEPRIIIDVFRGKTRDPILGLLSEFLDHPLDIDKTDYLIRDAHFSGVQLGLFPAERVMMTNRVVRDRSRKYVRAFMIKALHSLESLILSRNWMFSDLYLHHAVKLSEALISKATYFRIKEEALSKNECIGLFTRWTDADLYDWLGDSEIDFVREYISRIRYRRLFKVVLSRPISSFAIDVQSEFLRMLHDIERLMDAETEVAKEPGRVVIDVVSPDLGEEKLSRIPLLVGGERTGLEIIPLDETDEGAPLMKILRQQRRTIPSVRVYSDPGDANDILKRFERLFPLGTGRKYLDDEYDMTEV